MLSVLIILGNYRQFEGVTVTWPNNNFDILDLLFNKEYFGGKIRFLAVMDQILVFFACILMILTIFVSFPGCNWWRMCKIGKKFFFMCPDMILHKKCVGHWNSMLWPFYPDPYCLPDFSCVDPNFGPFYPNWGMMTS